MVYSLSHQLSHNAYSADKVATHCPSMENHLRRHATDWIVHTVEYKVYVM